ncbi:hypothetical protein [Streptomyces sp. NBC_01353]|uniref:hypothetical protein n=1 Tax=Streptomyces sp. NBC_01353 TaxID=2903835 RepID=UPI002E34C5E0|nr:hypothetical protein [Streptomyces sp. NBC_01353]
MRKLATVAVAAGLFLGGAGAATADGWKSLGEMQTLGAELQYPEYRWWPKGENHGGFSFRGRLKDLDSKDGHNVYVQVKVEGYSWNRFNGQQKKTVAMNKVVYDGAAQYTRNADIRVCRDRGSLRPDNCTPTKSYSRN